MPVIEMPITINPQFNWNALSGIYTTGNGIGPKGGGNPVPHPNGKFVIPTKVAIAQYFNQYFRSPYSYSENGDPYPLSSSGTGHVRSFPIQ